MSTNRPHMSISEESITEERLTKVQQSYLNTLIEQGIEKKIGSWKTIAVGFGVAFLLVMTAIVGFGVYCIADIANSTPQVAADVEKTGLLSADYLAVVIPLLLALGGAFVAFLGMNRLSNYDTRIDRTRTELLKEIALRIKSEMESLTASIAGKVTRQLDAKQKFFDNSVVNAETSLQDNLAKYLEELKEQFEEINQKYSWLKPAVQEKNVELDFHTVADAHNLVTKLRKERPTGYVKIIKNIVNIVETSDDLSADEDDYHNLAAELGSGYMYIEVCKVLWKGLSFFEKSTNLLADLVQYATKGSMIQDAESALEALHNIDSRLWTWRSYDFICDYYMAVGKLDEADELSTRYIEAMPTDERAYKSKSDVYKLLYPGEMGIQKSIEILRLAIERRVNCPLCANVLAETYLSLGEYEKALDVANIAVRESAQKIPSTNVKYIFYTRAVILDRMFMESIISNQLDIQFAQMADADYKMALNMGGFADTTLEKIQARIRILSQYTRPRYTEDEVIEMMRKQRESDDE